MTSSDWVGEPVTHKYNSSALGEITAVRTDCKPYLYKVIWELSPGDNITEAWYQLSLLRSIIDECVVSTARRLV